MSKIDINDTSYIKEDIDDTINFILDRKVGDVSPELISVLQQINPDIKNANDTKNELLENLITEKQSRDLNEQYFNLFSANTKEFILKHLDKGIQGTLEMNIDNSLRSSTYSNKPIIVSLEGTDLENNIIDEDFEYKSILDLENICKELLNYHYLGLGLPGGFFDSIILYKTKETKKKITNDQTKETKTIRTKGLLSTTYE